MNLILQIDEDTAHAVKLGAHASRRDMQSALDILCETAGIRPDIAPIAGAVGAAWPYASHRNYAAEGHDQVLDADVKRGN